MVQVVTVEISSFTEKPFRKNRAPRTKPIIKCESETTRTSRRKELNLGGNHFTINDHHRLFPVTSMWGLSKTSLAKKNWTELTKPSHEIKQLQKNGNWNSEAARQAQRKRRWRKRNFTRFVFQMTFNAQNSKNPWTLTMRLTTRGKEGEQTLKL